jgi:hypothetical protein
MLKSRMSPSGATLYDAVWLIEVSEDLNQFLEAK